MKQLLLRLSKYLVAFGATCLLTIEAGTAQEGTFAELTRKLPGNVNSVMAVNVEQISNSPIGLREKWATTYAGQTASGLMFVPEKAKVVLIGAVMDFESFHPKETALMMTMDKVPSVGEIRALTDGMVDELAGQEFVETKAGAFVRRDSDTLVVGLRPGDRSYFGKWLSDLKKASTEVKGYLEEGVKFADEHASIIMAFDLNNFVSRNKVYETIKEMELINKNAMDAKKVSAQIASMRGFTLGVTVSDKVFGAIKIDFEDDISSLEPVASEIAQSLLSRTGMQMEEFESWKITTSAKQIKLSGNLSTPSLRKILSLINVPRFDEKPYVSASESMNSDSPGSMTKRYFDTVNSFYDEVKAKITPATAYLENAKWLDNYANKIDGLSILDIDEVAVAYGNAVSQTLRDSATGLRNTNQTAKQVNQEMLAAGTRSGGGWGADVSWGGGYSYGSAGWGEGTNWGDGSRIRRAAQRKEKSEAIKSIVGLFASLDTDRRKVQQALTQKYGMDF